MTSVAAPLMRQNVDTDLVIASSAWSTTRGARFRALEADPFQPDGSGSQYVITEAYRGAPIILSSRQFRLRVES